MISDGGPLETLPFRHIRDLIDFAAQSYKYISGDVRMSGEPGQRALQQVNLRAAVVRAAAAFVGQSDDTVDMREVAQRITAEPLGHIARDRRRAVHRRDDRDVVARPGASIGTSKAIEGATLLARHDIDRTHISPERIVVLQPADVQIVRVDVLARRDGCGGEADHLPVAPHRGADLNRLERHLVPRRHRRSQHDSPAIRGHYQTAAERHARQRHRVLGMQTQRDLVQVGLPGATGSSRMVPDTMVPSRLHASLRGCGGCVHASTCRSEPSR